MVQLENRHLLTIPIISDSGKNHQRMLSYWAKVWRATGHWHSLKELPARFLLVTGNANNRRAEKAGRHHVNKATGLPRPGTGQRDALWLLVWGTEKGQRQLWIRPQGNTGKSQPEGHCTKDWPVLAEIISVMKCKGRLRNYSRFNESKEIWQLNAQCYLGFSFAREDISGTIKKIWICSESYVIALCRSCNSIT